MPVLARRLPGLVHGGEFDYGTYSGAWTVLVLLRHTFTLIARQTGGSTPPGGGLLRRPRQNHIRLKMQYHPLAGTFLRTVGRDRKNTGLQSPTKVKMCGLGRTKNTDTTSVYACYTAVKTKRAHRTVHHAPHRPVAQRCHRGDILAAVNHRYVYRFSSAVEVYGK